jgi:hypothetical protein
MKTLLTALFVLLGVTYQSSAQTPKSQCSRYDDRSAITTGNGQAVYYIEVCSVANQEAKPALSIVFSSSPDRRDAMRIYSYAATKPLSLDGIYIERDGKNLFIIHRSEIEWANGTKTQLDSFEPKKKKKFSDLIDAAFQLLKMAAENRRISSRTDQERLYRNTVVNFMFYYQLNANH